MNKNTLLIFAFFISKSAISQTFTNVSQDNSKVEINFSICKLPETLPTISINNESFIDFSQLFKVLLLEEGKPSLPSFGTTIELPAKGNPNFQIVEDEVQVFSNVLVAPSKGNLKRNVIPSDVSFSFGDIYQDNAFFPLNTTQLQQPFIWRSMRGSVLNVSPFQYNPVTKTLRVVKKMHIIVSYNESISGENELTNDFKDNVFSNTQRQTVLNPISTEKYSSIDEEGEMLIITTAALSPKVTPLVNWKNQKGIKTTIVTTTDIGGATTSLIKNYLTTYFQQHPNLIYVLVVGDHANIPAYSYGNSGGEELWSDSYYGQNLNGGSDYYPEAFVGRLSGTATQIEIQIKRILEYEKNPSAGTWMENAIGLGSNEGTGIGDDGQADWQHLRAIRTTLLANGYSTVNEFYDGSQGGEDASGNPSASIISPVVSAGVGLFNYTGHGDLNTCVTGNFNSNNVSAATNTGKYPFVVSVACNNGTFTTATCISEAWLNAGTVTQPKGAIAAAGSSILMSWAPPMETQDEMSVLIGESNASIRKETIGGLFYNSQSSMLENYPSPGIEVMQTWVLFGDPSTLFRYQETLPITVSHVSNVPQSTTSLTVNCTVEGALIAISQNNVLLGSSEVVGGNATITFPTLTTDLPLLVTATKQNHGVYQANVQVGNGPLSINEEVISYTIYPNPAANSFQIESNLITNGEVKVFNLAGELVKKTSWKTGEEISVNELLSGAYIIEIQSSNGIVRKSLNIIH